MIILGLSFFYHDSSACLVKDGKIIAAAQEERFTRVKHDNGFPKNAILFCLNFAGISAKEIDLIVFYEKPVLKFERVLSQHLSEFPKSEKSFLNSMGSWFSQKLRVRELLKEEISYHGKVYFIPHHLSHAASAYYLSGFEESAVVTLDGVGEWTTTSFGLAENGEIKLEKEIRFPHSLGLLYSAFTAYLGFKVNSAEYKVMGLAAYGNPKKYKKQFDRIIQQSRDGSFSLDMSFFDYTWADHMHNKNLENLFVLKTRQQESEVTEKHADIAAALQYKVEEVVFNLLNRVYKKYKTKKNLCLGGGVALNSVLNGKIVKKTPFRNIYINPDPGDGGGAMGAALYANYKFSNKQFKPASFSPYLGPEYQWFQVRRVLDKYKLKYTLFTKKNLLLKNVTKLLTEQKVVGWFQGRMEWGPRALGARSILAAANDSVMKKVLNEKVKKRETFRPFAPVIIGKYVERYFEIKDQPLNLAKYMLLVLPFKERGKKEASATVHVDGTGRLQSIERKDNPIYYSLIESYMKKTGSPIIINTSFNIRGEPIVCTPEDAVKCYLGTGIDALVIDNYIVVKNG